VNATRRVVYLSLGAPHLEYPGVVAALGERGVSSEMILVDEIDSVDWNNVSLVNARMCRGYHTHGNFLGRLNYLHEILQEVPGGPVPMANSIELLREAVDKNLYLRQLGNDGIELIPTRWLTRGSVVGVADLMDDMGWDDIVIKPTVSSGSWRTIRVSRKGSAMSESHFVLTGGMSIAPYDKDVGQLISTHDVFVQRFLPDVLDYGELSFIFLGGTFSHAVRKTVEDGGWWAHERLGGQNFLHKPTSEDLAWAENIHQALVSRYGPLWYGRIDGIRDKGRLLLLECELAIPRLLLPEGHAFDRYADALIQGIERGASQLDFRSAGMNRLGGGDGRAPHRKGSDPR
jgi:hypothetical protein